VKVPGDREKTLQFAWNYRPSEIIADAVVHLIGIALVLCGAIGLFIVVTDSRSVTVWAAGIYLLSLSMLFGLSAAYNLWPVSPIKWWLRRLDHSAIYILIAGTYTAFVLPMGGNFALIFLAAIWTVAWLGALIKVVYPGRFDRLSIAVYLALGWSGVFVVRELWSEPHYPR
jgi:hemolysin III